MTNRADFVVEAGGTLVAPAAFTTDYVVSVPSGTLVIDTAADGTSDCLAATGTLDLSNLSLKLGDANLNEEKTYTLATAAEITGKFVDEELPNRWRTFVQPTKVTLSYSNGTVLLIR